MKHKIVGKQKNSKLCFVCGMKNDLGLKAHFYATEGQELIALFKPCEEHQSYPGRLHGGVASAVLDETIGRAILNKYDTEVWGVTIELNVKFKKPIPLNEELKVVGRITKENNRIFEGTGEIYLQNGETAATAYGKYFKVPLERIADFDPEENEWKIIEKEDDPDEIEI
ncbi:thioesterase superfamily protein [Melioribacter roseus P3M-2]|uniref:Acyl-coenzyme A thioesterase THEM4 n=1 Tax=Melioribacter roseus (strain DSM 23840 / JCM 17771 / VKM B-2668 / P3M-2) TaxID=1191523 RepID=I6Z3X0_MELRP|nr:PaaI family thioesterase [Melioribacter roseus]AFN73845.1 thioesterase superfamily protein [Melioribacter roseus P3M-2]